MTSPDKGGKREFGATCKTVSLAKCFNWPRGRIAGPWWRELAGHVRGYPQGRQTAWGIPFQMGRGRAILVAQRTDDVAIPLTGRADFLCLLHEWRQLPQEISREDPTEGLVVGEYELAYADGTAHVQPVRARFEVAMAESPGPPWLALPLHMCHAIDPVDYPEAVGWGYAQTGTTGTHGSPLVYAMPNPQADKPLRSLTVRGLRKSPLLVAALTLYRGASHPLRHLPRRTYRVRAPGGPVEVEAADVDLGGVARVKKTSGPRGAKWLSSPYAGLSGAQEPAGRGEGLIEAFGSEDATLSVKLADRRARPRAATHGSRSWAGTGSGCRWSSATRTPESPCRPASISRARAASTSPPTGIIPRSTPAGSWTTAPTCRSAGGTSPTSPASSPPTCPRATCTWRSPRASSTRRSAGS